MPRRRRRRPRPRSPSGTASRAGHNAPRRPPKPGSARRRSPRPGVPGARGATETMRASARMADPMPAPRTARNPRFPSLHASAHRPASTRCRSGTRSPGSWPDELQVDSGDEGDRPPETPGTVPRCPWQRRAGRARASPRAAGGRRRGQTGPPSGPRTSVGPSIPSRGTKVHRERHFLVDLALRIRIRIGSREPCPALPRAHRNQHPPAGASWSTSASGPTVTRPPP
jgi:hypothetical protein